MSDVGCKVLTDYDISSRRLCAMGKNGKKAKTSPLGTVKFEAERYEEYKADAISCHTDGGLLFEKVLDIVEAAEAIDEFFASKFVKGHEVAETL